MADNLAENKQVNTMPQHLKLDLRATLLIRPVIERDVEGGTIEVAGQGLPQEISLAELKALLA